MNDKSSSLPTEQAAANAKANAAGSNEQAKKDLPNLGLSELEGHKGSISIEGDIPIESLILGYQAVGEIAEEIAKRVAKHEKRADEKATSNPDLQSGRL